MPCGGGIEDGVRGLGNAQPTEGGLGTLRQAHLLDHLERGEHVTDVVQPAHLVRVRDRGRVRGRGRARVRGRGRARLRVRVRVRVKVRVRVRVRVRVSTLVFIAAGSGRYRGDIREIYGRYTGDIGLAPWSSSRQGRARAARHRLGAPGASAQPG